jgi:hypothetical protein
MSRLGSKRTCLFDYRKKLLKNFRENYPNISESAKINHVFAKIECHRFFQANVFGNKLAKIFIPVNIFIKCRLFSYLLKWFSGKMR